MDDLERQHKRAGVMAVALQAVAMCDKQPSQGHIKSSAFLLTFF